MYIVQYSILYCSARFSQVFLTDVNSAYYTACPLTTVFAITCLSHNCSCEQLSVEQMAQRINVREQLSVEQLHANNCPHTKMTQSLHWDLLPIYVKCILLLEVFTFPLLFFRIPTARTAIATWTIIPQSTQIFPK
jgi:hypothetical protein